MNDGKREAERFYSKATKDFDRWFYSQPKGRQSAMRADGVLPYREMKAAEYVFPVNTMSESAVVTPLHDPNDDAGSETFYAREKVEEFTRRLLKTLEYSHSPEVRLHFELVRLVLRDAEAMTNDALSRQFGMTRAGINFRVQRIRQLLSGEKLSNENNNRKERKAGGVRLPEVPRALPKKQRKDNRLQKRASGKARAKIQKIQKGLER